MRAGECACYCLERVCLVLCLEWACLLLPGAGVPATACPLPVHAYVQARIRMCPHMHMRAGSPGAATGGTWASKPPAAVAGGALPVSRLLGKPAANSSAGAGAGPAGRNASGGPAAPSSGAAGAGSGRAGGGAAGDLGSVRRTVSAQTVFGRSTVTTPPGQVRAGRGAGGGEGDPGQLRTLPCCARLSVSD